MQSIGDTVKRIALPNGLKGAKRLTEAEYEALKQQSFARNVLPCDIDCPECHGYGLVQVNAAAHHTSPEFGKARPCSRLYARTLRSNAHKYGLTEDEVTDYDWNMVLDLNDAIKTSKQVQAVLQRKYGLIYLWGDNGQAKTLLLKIAAAVSLRDMIPAAYINMADLMRDLKSAYDEKDSARAFEDKLEFWTGVNVLCLDEFNRLKESDYVKEQRFVLMDRRNVQAVRQETVTLLASNTPPSAQEKYMQSRLEDGRFQIIHVTGNDARAGMTADYKY